MNTEILHETITMQSKNEDTILCDVTADGEFVGNLQDSTGQYEAVRRFNSEFQKEYRKIHQNCAKEDKRVSEPYDERNNIKQTKQNDSCDEMRDESNTDSKEQRAKINMRERKRMHDLNKAMEGLREVMPCANGPSMRKLSKIATLSLARNYIQMLTKSIEELKLMLDDVYRTQGGRSMMRRQPAVTIHPYGPYFGVSNNFNNYYTAGFDQCVNIYSNSNSIAGSRYVGLRCCNGPTTTYGRRRHNAVPPKHTYI